MPVPPTQRTSAPAYAPAALVAKSTSQNLRPSYASCAKKAVEREKVTTPKTTTLTSTINELGKETTATHSASPMLASVPEGKMTSFESDFSTTKSTLPGSPGSDAYSDEESIEIITTRTPREAPILSTRLRAPLSISPPNTLIPEQHRPSDQVSQTASTPSLSASSSPTSTVLPLNIEPTGTAPITPLERSPPVLTIKVPGRDIYLSSKPRQLSMSRAEAAPKPQLQFDATPILSGIVTPARPSFPNLPHHHNIKKMTLGPLPRAKYKATVRTQRPRWSSMDDVDASDDEIIPFPPLPPTPFASLNDPPTADYDLYSEVDGSQPWSLDGVFINDDPQRGLAVSACWTGANSLDGEFSTELYSQPRETSMFVTQYAAYSTTEQLPQFVPHGMTTSLANVVAVQLQPNAAGFPATAYYIPPPPVITHLTTTDTAALVPTDPTESHPDTSGAATELQAETHRQTQPPSGFTPQFGAAQSIQATAAAAVASASLTSLADSGVIPTMPSHAIELAIAHAVGSMPPAIRTPNRNKYNHNSERSHRMLRYSGGYNKSGHPTPNKYNAASNTSFDHGIDRSEYRNSHNSYIPTSDRRLGPGAPVVQVERRGSVASTSTDRRSSIDPNGGLGGGCLLGAAYPTPHKGREQRPNKASSPSSDGVAENAVIGNGSAGLSGQRLDGSHGGVAGIGKGRNAFPSGHHNTDVDITDSDYGHGGYTGRSRPDRRGGANRVRSGDGSFTWS